MRFSIYTLLQWPDDRCRGNGFQNELEELTRAESQGYHCAWLGEPAVSKFGLGPAIQLAAANLATRTQDIRIGIDFSLLPFTHPLHIAEEVAMLDLLSEGRVEARLKGGISGREEDPAFEGGGTTRELRFKRFGEQLEVIQNAWTGKPFAHAGAFYNFNQLQCIPHPIQQPGPTVYLAAASEAAIEWAAHHHYPVWAGPFSPPADLKRNRQHYVDAASTAGADTSALEIPTLRLVHVGESMKKAREDTAPGLLAYCRSLAFDLNHDPESLLTFLFDECAIIGDAAYCRDRIAKLQEMLDLSELMAWQSFGNLSHEQTLASQERLMTQVAPAFA